VETAFYIIAKTVQICLGLASFSMIARMLLPIFVNPMESRLYALSCYVSEPFVLPVRFVMSKLNIGQNTPIDVAFIVAYLIVWVLELILPVI
jgi:YggT family protein